jgi:hypothetical protein
MNTDLETEFKLWMSQQTKANGEKYSSDTISTRANALNTIISRLNLTKKLLPDIFHYNTLDDFNNVYNEITSLPEFVSVNSVGNNHYSSALNLYRRFLVYYSSHGAFSPSVALQSKKSNRFLQIIINCISQYAKTIKNKGL